MKTTVKERFTKANIILLVIGNRAFKRDQAWMENHVLLHICVWVCHILFHRAILEEFALMDHYSDDGAISPVDSRGRLSLQDIIAAGRDVETPSPAIYPKDKRGLRVPRRPLFLCNFALMPLWQGNRTRP